jgi:MFS family permease
VVRHDVATTIVSTPPASDGRVGRLALTLRALRHRNFRLFTLGQSISLIGTWMQQVAVAWLVYRMTQSPFALGLVGFVAHAPGFLIAPFAGVLADRFDKRSIVVTTQLVMMLQALVLATLVLTGAVTLGWVLVLMAVLGCATGLDIPARQSFLVQLVDDRADLPNAIALNSSMFNLARLVGPAVAGFAIAAIGEGWVILANGLSYLFVLAALLAMRIPRAPAPHQGAAMLQHLRDGVHYVLGSAPIAGVLLLVATMGLLGLPFTVLLPVVADSVLGGGARTLGMLMAATGLGALAGALFLASRSTVRGIGRLIVISATLFGTSLVLFAFVRTAVIAVPLLAVAGFAMMVLLAGSNTVLQTLVDDDKRGRVMSFYTMAFLGTTPLGSLLAGAVASRIGVSWTIAFGGAACLATAALFARRLPALRAQVQPIYRRLGILPELARGIQAATHQATPEAKD